MILKDDEFNTLCPFCNEKIDNPLAKYCQNCGESLVDLNVKGTTDEENDDNEADALEESGTVQPVSDSETLDNTQVSSPNNYSVDARKSEGPIAVGPYATSVKAKDVKVELESEKTTFTADKLTVNFGQEPKITIWSITKDREKADEVFVEPENYQDVLKNIETQKSRIFIVYGVEESDKYLYAVKLGNDLQLHNRMQHNLIGVRLLDERNYSLSLILDQKEVKGKSICIISDTKQNFIKDLDQFFIDQVNDVLFHKDMYLILLVTYQQSFWDFSRVCTISANVEALNEVFIKYNKWNFNKLDYRPLLYKVISELNISEVVNKLNTAQKINKFFLYLLRPEVEKEIQVLLEDQTNIEKLRGFFLNIIQKVERESYLILESSHSWFQKLHDNHQLYAILAVLFEGLDRSVLDEIYFQSVKLLRSEGIQGIKDSREIGIDDLLETLQVVEEEGEIRFIYPSQIGEIRKQIKNRHHLLWSLVPLFEQIIEEIKGPENWEMRRAFGIAIGRLGIAHPQKLIDELDKLALHQSGGVVVVAGYAMEELCRNSLDFYPLVLNVLKEWVKSKDPEYTWAAAASIWRVYSSLSLGLDQKSSDISPTVKSLTDLRKPLWDLLKDLSLNIDNFNEETYINALAIALQKQVDSSINLNQEVQGDIREKMLGKLREWRNRNVDVILHAIRQIAHEDLSDAVENLTSWLQPDDEHGLRLIGELSANQFFNPNTPDNYYSEINCRPLLDLIYPLIIANLDRAEIIYQVLIENNTEENRTSDKVLENLYKYSILNIFKCINKWFYCSSWIDRENEIKQALIKIINRSSPRELEIIRKCIFLCFINGNLNDTTSITYKIGQSLFARSYSAEGNPGFPFSSWVGIIALDASEIGWNKSSNIISDELFTRLNSRMNVHIYLMGNSINYYDLNYSYKTLTKNKNHNLPCLLAGALHKIDNNQMSKTVCLLSFASDKILDLDDLIGSPLENKITLINTKGYKIIAGETNKSKDDDWQKTISTVVMEEDGSGLAEIELFIHDYVVRKLAEVNAEEFREILSPFLISESGFEEDVMTKLDFWVSDLDSIHNAEAKQDTGFLILLYIIWLSRESFSRSVELLIKWLKSEAAESPIKNFSATASKLLIETLLIRSSRPTNGEVDQAFKLIVVLLENTNEWKIIEAILKFIIFTLSSFPDRYELSLNGLSSKEKDFGFNIDFKTLIKHIKSKDIIKLNSLLDKSLFDTTLPATIYKLVVHLKMVLGVLTLKEGQKYGIIMIDSSEKRSPSLIKTVRQFLNGIYKSELGKTIEPIVYYLGNSYPILNDDLGNVFTPLPTLSTSIVGKFQPNNVGFILIFSNSILLDAIDWLEDWKEIPVVLFSEVKSIDSKQLLGDDYEYPLVSFVAKSSADEPPASLIHKHLTEILKG